MVRETKTIAGGNKMLHPLQIWHWLTNPSPSRQEPELHRRSRLLLSILVVVFLLVVFILALTPVELMLFSDPEQRHLLTFTYPLILIPAAFPLAIAYVLSRKSYYKAPALIMIITIMFLTFANLLAAKQLGDVFFPSLPVVLASVLLSRRMTLAVCAASVAGMLMLPVVTPAFSFWDLISPSILMIAVGVLTSVAADIHHRDLVQIEHQARTLEENQEKLLGAKKMEAVARLSAGIAHEFNNIVMAIIGYSDVIAKKPAESAQHYAQLINIAGIRASQLTENLLSFSRQQLLRPRKTNLDQLMASLEHLFRSMLSSGITLTMRPDPDPKVVYVDPDLISQCVRTLVGKAVNNLKGGGSIAIETKNIAIPQEGSELSLRPGLYCSVIISDSGPVIDKGVLTRLFDPYFTMGEFGTGDLELAAAYGIVRQSGGQIDVNSDPERGNSFTVLLPQQEHDS
jgi:signal transduction histidine kinase